MINSNIKMFVTSAVLAVGIVHSASASQLPENTVVKHEGQFAGETIEFNSIVESFSLEPLEAAPLDVVSISYIEQPVKSEKPVLFAFNGGPISPSVYLHMLALGPWRLAVSDDLNADPSSFPVVPNEYSPLDKADIVFFDPAGTGFSRFRENTTPQTYFGYSSDATEFVSFMEAWLIRHGRSEAPVYILGESYGTMRAAAIAMQLSEKKSSVQLSGIFLVGQALNLIETAQRHDNVMTYVVSLPTLAALGWYHEKLPGKKPEFESLMTQVNNFAYGDYLSVLLKGNQATQSEKLRIAERLAGLTGLDAAVHLNYDLRISKNEFRGELMKHEGLVAGANDGRYLRAPAEESPLPDGVSDIYPRVYESFETVAESHLGLTATDNYTVSSPVTSLAEWDWGSKAGPFANFPYANGIADAMMYYPNLTVMVGAGHYDTLTTTGATDYLLRHADWPKDRVMQRTYFGGHMAYTVEENLAQFSRDIKDLIAR